MIYEIINSQDIPDNLSPGKYKTKVISFEYDYEKRDYVLKVEWLNEEYKEFNCLFPLTKH